MVSVVGEGLSGEKGWKRGVWFGRGGEGIWIPSIGYVGYNAVFMCDEEFCYGGAHVAGGDDGEGCEGRHCGSFLEGLWNMVG